MASNTSPNRFFRFIAYLQIIGIILVVLGHSFHEYPDGEFGTSLLIYRMMHSFRMPLFIFVSGFLMVFTTLMRGSIPAWRRFAAGKVRRLLIPFITLTLVTFLPRALLSHMADDPLELSPRSVIYSLLYQDHLVIPYFWFLQVSIVLLLLTFGIILIARRFRINDLFTFLALIALYAILPHLDLGAGAFWSLRDCTSLALYFALGCAYARFMPAVDRIIPWDSVIFLLISALCWGFLFPLTEHTPFMPLCSIFGIMMCVSLAKLLEKHNLRFLDHLIGANYIIFLLSWYFNVITQQVLHHFTELPWWVYSILSLLCGIYIPWLAYRYMTRHPHSRLTAAANLLLGQSIRPPR